MLKEGLRDDLRRIDELIREQQATAAAGVESSRQLALTMRHQIMVPERQLGKAREHTASLTRSVQPVGLVR